MKKWFTEILFLRFLQFTYRKFSKLFYFFLFFIAVQIVLLFLKLEVTPFFLYGMYSQKISYTEIHKTTSVYVNGQDISTLAIPLRERDMLLTGIENYLSMKQNGGTDVVQTRVESSYHFLTTSLLYPFLKKNIYNKPEALPLFETWFKQKCSRYTKAPVEQIKIIYKYYKFNTQPSSVTPFKTELVAFF